MKKNLKPGESSVKNIAVIKLLVVMKLIIVFISVVSLNLSFGSGYAQETKLDVNVTDISIRQVLKVIEGKSEFSFMYDNTTVVLEKTVSINVRDKTIFEILDRILDKNEIKYQVIDRHIVLLPVEKGREERVITGTVISSEDDSELPGVNVLIKGSNHGTITDMDGNFLLKVPDEENVVLVFSYVGYIQEEVVLGNRNVIDVSLIPDITSLEEVVIIAYGTTKKASFTGSAAFIETDAIQKSASSNLSNALQGLSAGVQVVAPIGKPGGDASIQIRGFGSMSASNNPLIILNGIPYDGSLSSIAPNEIESVSILKDAVSTSLYGSRAANGVILITTKKGTPGKTVVNFKSTWGTSDFAVALPQKMNSDQQYEAVWEGFYYDYLVAGKTDNEARELASNKVTDRFYIARPHTNYLGETRNYRSNYNMDKPVGLDGKIKEGAFQLYEYDWTDLFEKKLRQEYSLDISTGLTEKTRLFFATSLMDDQGQYLNQRFRRWSTRANVSTQISEKISIDASLNYIKNDQNDPGESTRFVRTIPNTIHPYQFDHERGGFMTDAYGNLALERGGGQSYSGRRFFGGNNPFEFSIDPYEPDSYAFNVNKDHKLINQVSVNFEFLENLNLRSSFSADLSIHNRHRYRSPVFGIVTRPGWASKANTTRFGYTWNNILNYLFDFNGHKFNLMAGNEIYAWRSDNVSSYKEGFPVPGIFEVNAASAEPNAVSSSNEYSLASAMSRLEYNFKDKVYASASFRADGSSRFHPDNRWGYFWSVGGGWRISEENFMLDVGWLDNLKLKASYGTTGNDKISLYAYQALFDPAYSFYEESGAIEKRLPTAELGWEKNVQFNTGFEFLVGGRFSGEVEYFIRQSNDLLFSRPLPQSFGITSVDDNIAKVENKGFELTLGYQILKNSDLKWDISLNTTHFKNEIKEMPLEEMFVPGSSIRKWVAGKSIYEFWTPTWAGVDPETGDNTWYKNVFDEAGNVTGQEITHKWAEANNEDHRTYQGSSLPDFFGSVTNSFSYKGIDLSFMFYYSVGGVMYDVVWRENVNMRNAFGLITYWIDNHWTPENTEARIPRPSHKNFGDNGRATNQYMFTNDFLRLRNLNIGYTLPQSVSNKIRVGSLRVFAQGENLATWGPAARRGTDPEVAGFDGITNYNYAVRKTVVGGIQIQF
ncbi:MAG: TonB-dependent receptor [Cytophagales bacterium]|nr:TonB-dependent receptor [Cytophagales bacterium]